MYHFPQQQLESHYEYVVQNATDAPVRGTIFQQFNLGIASLASQIKSQFPNGIEWGNIPQLLKQALSVLDQFTDIQNRKAAVLSLVDKVIDLTDTPFLVDAATDPILKSIAQSLVDAYFNIGAPAQPAGQTIVTSFISSAGESFAVEPSADDLKQFAMQLKGVFEDHFKPSDIANLVTLSQQFMNKFSGLSIDQTRECVIKIINNFIDITDASYFPDSLIDPMMKQIVPSFVNFLVN